MNTVSAYSIAWNAREHRGLIVATVEGRKDPIRIPVTDPAEFCAIGIILRRDPNHEVFLDPDTGMFFSGKDKP